MGTSGRSGGSGSNTSLVPTFLDEPPQRPLPGEAPPDGAEAGTNDSDPGPPPRPDIEMPPVPARFQTARRNFSTFARSGGSDRGALRRAVSDYVRSGTQGSTNAVRRMGASRNAGSAVLGMFRGFQRDGVEASLRRLNLDRLIGRPARDIFVGLTDVICQDGGQIDEGIARDAWLETVADLDQFGIDDLNALNIDQIQGVLITFIVHAVETRLFQDIGANGLDIASDLSAIEYPLGVSYEDLFHF
jgi:hypothetical protein